MKNIQKAIALAQNAIVNHDYSGDVNEYINDIANRFATNYNEYMEIWKRLNAIYEINR